MNIHIHSDRLDLHVAASLYIAAMEIPGVHITHPDDADFVINVDSIHNSGLMRGKKTVYYELDDTMHQGRNTQFYDVDLLYIVTKEYLPLYPKNTKTLPVAMNPTVHYHWGFPEVFDLVFVGETGGNECYMYRKSMIELLSSKFKFLATNCPPQNYSKYMSQGKIRFNAMPHSPGRSPLINTRFYESMGIGLTMNDYHKSIDELGILDGKHYIGYSSPEDAIEKTQFYIRNEANRNEIGSAGKSLMLEKHTWRHRLSKIISDYEKII